MIRNFINLTDFTAEQLSALLDKALSDKALLRRGALAPTLAGKTLAMIFEKPSLRTRVSFETAMTQLGGHAIYLTQSDIGLGHREPAQDVARDVRAVREALAERSLDGKALRRALRRSLGRNGIRRHDRPA